MTRRYRAALYGALPDASIGIASRHDARPMAGIVTIISADGDQLTRQYERSGNGIFHDGLLMDVIASDLEHNGRSVTGNGEESVFAEGDTVEFVGASSIYGLQPGQSGTVVGVHRDNRTFIVRFEHGDGTVGMCDIVYTLLCRRETSHA